MPTFPNTPLQVRVALFQVTSKPLQTGPEPDLYYHTHGPSVKVGKRVYNILHSDFCSVLKSFNEKTYINKTGELTGLTVNCYTVSGRNSYKTLC